MLFLRDWGDRAAARSKHMLVTTLDIKRHSGIAARRYMYKNARRRLIKIYMRAAPEKSERVSLFSLSHSQPTNYTGERECGGVVVFFPLGKLNVPALHK
jgi:hypothetical protein